MSRALVQVERARVGERLQASLADQLLVDSAEAAALGVPVYTTYGGRLGGVDEELIREGRLKPLTDPRALDLHKRARGDDGQRVRRDPALMLELLLSSAPSTSSP